MDCEGRKPRDDAVLSDRWRLAASLSGLVSLAGIEEREKGPIHAEGCKGRVGREASVCPEDWCCTETVHNQELPRVQQL